MALCYRRLWSSCHSLFWGKKRPALGGLRNYSCAQGRAGSGNMVS